MTLAGKDPRRAGLARSPPSGRGCFHGQQLIGGGLADLGELVRGELREVPVLLVPGRVVVLAGPVQPGLPFRGAVQPGEILVPPRIRGNRFRRYVLPPVRDIKPNRT
jgi:hypothetical protein